MLRQHRVILIYFVPNFQNPTGRTLSLERRRTIASILGRNDALLLEDDPYWRLRYDGVDLPAIKSLASDKVIYISTFFKLLAPGLRLGWVIAPKSIYRWLVSAKQGADLRASSLS